MIHYEMYEISSQHCSIRMKIDYLIMILFVHDHLKKAKNKIDKKNKQKIKEHKQKFYKILFKTIETS